MQERKKNNGSDTSEALDLRTSSSQKDRGGKRRKDHRSDVEDEPELRSRSRKSTSSRARHEHDRKNS